MWPSARARRVASSSSAGIGKKVGSKSPTVRLQMVAPLAFRPRISEAILRISEPMTPRARLDKPLSASSSGGKSGVIVIARGA